MLASKETSSMLIECDSPPVNTHCVITYNVYLAARKTQDIAKHKMATWCSSEESRCI